MLFLWAALTALAGACDVCSGRTIYEAPTQSVVLDGDLGDCACEFVFAYSAGPTLGRIQIDIPPGAASAVAVYDSTEPGIEPVAEFDADDTLRDVVFRSRTGVLRVSFSTVAAVPAGAAIALVATAINQAPLIEYRQDVPFTSYSILGFQPYYVAFGETIPLPATVRDADNWNAGLRAELEVVTEDGGGFSTITPTISLVIPALEGLSFVVGEADTQVRRAVVSGPGDVVEAAIAAARLVPIDLTAVGSGDTIYVTVSDLGNSGEGAGPLVTSLTLVVATYPSGIVPVPRGAPNRITSGVVQPAAGTTAVYQATAAYRLDFLKLTLLCDPETFLVVWDGPDAVTGRLLSTEQSASGRLCAEDSSLLPGYTGTTGFFTVEYSTTSYLSSFEVLLTETPEGFRAWLLDGHRDVHVARGASRVSLPQVMVTGLPDVSEISVEVVASVGSVDLRFADSFVDILVDSAPGVVSLRAASDDGHPMLRIGDALQQLQYTPPVSDAASDTVSVRATSGGAEAVLEITVRLEEIAINAPLEMSLSAFRPWPIAVTVALAADAGDMVDVTVATASGIGAVSLDHRAAHWVDIGYGPNVTIAGTVAEVNTALRDLVYKAHFGGAETITVRAGAVSRSIAVTVDPECRGEHIIYAREGSITEKAGQRTSRFSAELACTWSIFGAREIAFPYYDITIGNFFGVSTEGGALFSAFLPFPAPGTLRAPIPYLFVQLAAFGIQGGGFVGNYHSLPGINDPPVLVVPNEATVVVRGSTTRLVGLYADDFSEDAVTASLETDGGSLRTEGNRLVEITDATFEELDAWITGIDFLAGDAQITATLTLRATDSAGDESEAQFVVEVLPCSGTVEVDLTDGSASIVVSDGSGAANYAPQLACGWRLTGAPAPAALSVAFLDLDCTGDDTVTVFDGPSEAGRLLGSFCRADQVAAQVGTLVASTGSFFVALSTDGDGAEDDGFSFVYETVAAGRATGLGAAPTGTDPNRADSTLVLLDGTHIVVFGGHNGVRAVSSVLVLDLDATWRVFESVAGPSARSRAAGAAKSATQFVVHGGVDASGALLAETWVADVDVGAATVSWTQLRESGPVTAAAAMHTHDGSVYLIDESGVSVLGSDDEWAAVGPTPATIAPTSSAYRPEDGLVYVAGADGALWSLSLATATWASLDADLGIECAPWTCSGAMLGPHEYVVGGSRVNVTSLTVDTLPAAAAGQAVGGQFLGQASLFIYEAGAVAAVPLTLGASSHTPLVSPETGGTVLTVAGERFSTCGAPQCEFGDGISVPVLLLSDRTGTCTTPAGLGPATIGVKLACADGQRYSTGEPLGVFEEPTVASIAPSLPLPGETILVTLEGVPEDVLALAAGPLCKFDDGAAVAGSLDGTILRCTVPESLGRGATATLRVSLDGQQFGSVTDVDLGGASGSTGLTAIIASVSSAIFLILAAVIVRYRRLANTRVEAGPAPWEIKFDSIDLEVVIGSGAYGSVYRGRFRGGEVAVKMAKADTVTPQSIEAFRKESALMAELRHPNIVLFMGACTEPPNIAIVLEFMPNGTLFELIQDDTIVLRRAEQHGFALDIAKGMAYLHAAEPPIVHRDLKSLNVLVDKSWNLKVSDFGLTEVFDDKDAEAQGEVAGSVYWMAPEMLKGSPASRATDVYAFGVTLWEIVSRTVPYHGMDPMAIAYRMRQTPSMRPQSEIPLEAPLDSIIEDCWATDPAVRPTFEAVQARLSESRRSLDEGSILSDSLFLSDALMPGDACAVVLRVAGGPSLWEDRPAVMWKLVDTMHGCANEIAGDLSIHVYPGEGEALLCICNTATDGIALAARVQMGLAEQPAGDQVAAGVATGEVRQTTDPVTRRKLVEGSAVTAATALGNSCGPGQILAKAEIVHGVDTAALKVVAVPDSDDDLVALYPEALQGRDGGGAKQDSTAFDEPSWMLKVTDVEIMEMIGAGTLGTVFRGEWNGTPVAAKQLHRKRLGQKETLDLRFEAGIASKLRHPNVCQFLGVVRDEAGGRILIVSELMTKGSVFDAIVMARRQIAAKNKFKVAKGLALGLRYLHDQEPVVVHRSLSARNVLLTRDWTAKISDFGLARTKSGAATMTKIGLTAYSAPELLRGEKYDEKVDVYAFAMVLWEMAMQETAFSGDGGHVGALAQRILGGLRPSPSKKTPEGLGPVIALAARCWASDPAARPGMEECCEGLSQVE